MSTLAIWRSAEDEFVSVLHATGAEHRRRHGDCWSHTPIDADLLKRQDEARAAANRAACAYSDSLKAADKSAAH